MINNQHQIFSSATKFSNDPFLGINPLFQNEFYRNKIETFPYSSPFPSIAAQLNINELPASKLSNYDDVKQNALLEILSTDCREYFQVSVYQAGQHNQMVF